MENSYPEEMLLNITPNVGLGVKNEYGVTTEYFAYTHIMPSIGSWILGGGVRVRLGGAFLL